MNHLYFEEEKVSAFASALANTAPFREGPFLLYRDVPLNALTYEAPCFRSARNLEAMDAHTARQSVDFLVCKGESAVLGITFDFDPRDSELLFGTVLRGIPHIAVNSCDFEQQDFDTEGMLQQVLGLLAETAPTEYILRVVTAPAIRQIPELQKLRLINQYGYATMYGKDCGLFFSCRTDKSGVVYECPAFAGKGWSEYMNAIHYCADGRWDSLAELLDCPIADFFEHHTEQWDALIQAMADAAKQG